MLRTRYASGRDTLPAPTVNTIAGSLNGGGATYYFWIKARNRVGWSNPSNSTSLVVNAAENIEIAASNFSVFPWEDWRQFIITFNTTDDFASSKVIARIELYEDDQITLKTISDIVISNQFIFSGNNVVPDIASLPTSSLPDGFRIAITNLGNVYEYQSNSVELPDNLTIINAPSGGNFILVSSNSLTEIDTNYIKELFQVVEDDLEKADLPISSSIDIPVKYYIVNDEPNALTLGQLDLNVYLSDISIKLEYSITILGYLDLSTYTLDTTGISYVNSAFLYPGIKFEITKPLPVNSALVFEVLPILDVNSTILPGTFISLYPRLNNYITVDEILTWSEGVANLTELKAIPISLIKNQQSINVQSNNTIYTYNSTNTDADNGENIIIPASNPSSGRWIANSTVLLDGAVTLSKLDASVAELLDDKLDNSSVTLNTSQTYIIDLDALISDYLILTTPIDDGNDTIINFSSTELQNGETVAIALELIQRSGTVIFDNSILFPGGIAPQLSGDGSTDLLLLYIVKDNQGNIKKRASVQNKNIG